MKNKIKLFVSIIAMFTVLLAFSAYALEIYPVDFQLVKSMRSIEGTISSNEISMMSINGITEKKEISIEYYRMDRKWGTHRLYPASVMFTDYYFYLIAFCVDEKNEKPYYFRMDRIKHITVHRKRAENSSMPDFDEGLLRKRSLFMWPGKLQNIRFEFSGPSVQAVLDKLPTAKIIERLSGGKYLIEAEVYGDGIKMWLLSQGAWVKVVSPDDFVAEMREEIKKIYDFYN